jgi:hypothetical protein
MKKIISFFTKNAVKLFLLFFTFLITLNSYFNRCVNQGTLTIVDSDGKIYDFPAFDAGPGYERDMYGTNFQIPPGIYDVTPRPYSAGGKYPGYPTISDNANRNWNELKSPKGTIRAGIQMHYGKNHRWSKGCIGEHYLFLARNTMKARENIDYFYYNFS